MAESNGSSLPGLWRDSLHVTCGLTACKPGSAPGPTLGNEYGKTLLFTFMLARLMQVALHIAGRSGPVVSAYDCEPALTLLLLLLLWLLQACLRPIRWNLLVTSSICCRRCSNTI